MMHIKHTHIGITLDPSCGWKFLQTAFLVRAKQVYIHTHFFNFFSFVLRCLFSLLLVCLALFITRGRDVSLEQTDLSMNGVAVYR